MTTLTIEIPDSETLSVSRFIKAKGGTVLAVKAKKVTKDASALKSLEQGLKEAIMISKGEIKPAPLSQLWDE
jgi:hypothetical protein